MEDKGVGIVQTRGVELQWVPIKVIVHGELWGCSGLLGLSYLKAREPGLYTITTPVLGYTRLPLRKRREVGWNVFLILRAILGAEFIRASSHQDSPQRGFQVLQPLREISKGHAPDHYFGLTMRKYKPNLAKDLHRCVSPGIASRGILLPGREGDRERERFRSKIFFSYWLLFFHIGILLGRK